VKKRRQLGPKDEDNGSLTKTGSQSSLGLMHPPTKKKQAKTIGTIIRSFKKNPGDVKVQ
jgi:hypothetical protein